MSEWHIGRSFAPATTLEKDCPCEKAPCGLAISPATVDCAQHSPWAMKTIRQMHARHDCPALREAP